ncbi:MAG: asparagine--tRNA ligase [Nanoarchaeota archaeon]|nr:asparagine--tRNA ligase [Nanoarchaeota archaeon]MBU1445508.1 asparagine--tRNA ligase [Nanoarchaeota archaeon]MBU2406423.1 asparagine--tRNA ligase [Nanoarchaeota archaeon]MBU2420680.1 asparagine--tRNA ligase [Nanoarchaeota archaeon]MBU2475679.1 asparagine--tRNA ligase [Nanoarchaeota archaeon]
MKYLTIAEALDKGKGKVAIRGWIYRERSLKDKVFLVVRDSTDIVQCVVKDKLYDQAKELLIESSVKIEGTIRADKRAPTGFEIDVEKLDIVHKAEKYPITKDQSIEFLADKRHLWIRSRKMTAILKVRSSVFGAIHEFFRSKGFYEFQSPILQTTQCEGGSTLFEVKYFKDKMFLAQTWQLYAEAALFALEKIYTIAPSFRAETSKTSRHLTEYWHAEMEVAWESFEDLQDYAEDLLQFIVKRVLKECKKELKILGRDIKKLEPSAKKKYKRITYSEALKLLDKKGFKLKWGKDLRTVEEDELSKMFDVPVIITHYPKEVKAFYMKEDKKETVLGFDVIGPEGYGELIGASEREVDIDKLKKRLKEQGEDPKHYEYYLDTRRYGSVPHGGFGMGVERVVAWICGLDSIKDAIGFPRTMLRFKP